MEETRTVKILYRNTPFQLTFNKESRFSQLAAQFHLNCRNIQGLKITFKYRQQVIAKLSQSIVDVVGDDPSPTLQLLSYQRQPKSNTNNIRFYEGELKAPGLGMTIDQLLDCKGNYRFLEQAHDYIQWLFPNHFKSSFNELSFMLSLEQAEQFRRNGMIGKRVFRAYDLIMDFYGIQVLNTMGDLVLKHPERFESALLKNIHNHIRIRRILASLSVIGFRRLACKLINFINNTIKSRYPGKLEGTFANTWGKYSNKDINAALKNCGITQSQIFQIENPYVQDLTDTSYSLWRGYPNSKHSMTLIQILTSEDSQVFFDLIQLIFPLASRDIEDVKTIYGFQNLMERVVQMASKHLKSQPNHQSILLTISESLRKFNLEHLRQQLPLKP